MTKIKKALLIADAEARFLAAQQATLTGPIQPGDVFVLPIKTDITLSWLFVRQHPDDAESLLFVPVDTFHLAGCCDYKINRSSIVRCGHRCRVSVTIQR